MARAATKKLEQVAAGSYGQSSCVAEVREWVTAALAANLGDSDVVLALLTEAKAEAESQDRRVQKAEADSWGAWIHAGPAGGLKRQHHFVRGAHGWTPARVANGIAPDVDVLDEDVHPATVRQLRALIVDPGEVPVPLGTQQAVEAEADGCGTYWADGELPPPLPWPSSLGPPPPPPTVLELISACLCFPLGTGLGWDAWHPRALARLPLALLEALVRLLTAAERVGAWPDAIGLVIIALLPKPEGGFRPIGLFPSLVRVWMKLRRPCMQRWEALHPRDYLYAGRGKGAEVAAWEQAARAEVTASSRAAYGQVLLDVVKCFETIHMTFWSGKPRSWTTTCGC